MLLIDKGLSMSKIESLIEVVLEIGNFTFATDCVDGHYNVRITPQIKKPERHRFVSDVLLMETEDHDRCSFPAGTNNGTGVTKTCFLMPRDRRVHFGDTFSFRIHLLEYLHRMRRVFERFTFTFKVEVYRSAVGCKGNYYDQFQCISSRTLVLNFDPTNALSLHVPLMMCFSPITLLNITVFGALVYICPPTPRLAALCKTSCQFEDVLFSYLEDKKAKEGQRVCSARLVHREMCYVLLNALGNIHDATLSVFQLLHPREDIDLFNKICPKDTFMKIQSVSQVVSSERAFVEFARETVATLCCLNALLWEAFLRLVVGRARAKHFLCAEYYRKKAEHFQELYFSCEKDRCSCVLSSRGCMFLKLKDRIDLFRRTEWIMSEPEFVGVAKRTLIFRQLHGSCERIGAIYRSSEPIHFVVFVNGLGGKSSDFFWAKRWMKLLIGAPKHILIWSEANEQEQTFDEISVCGTRLAVEVASYLDNIGTTNFKLSFVGFSLGCVLVRAALTCAQMRPYIRNLHTFFSINGPHLGIVYVKNKFLRFQISVLSKIKMKGSVKELTFQDSTDLRRCYLYILSQAPGKTYDEMIKNLLGPLLKRDDVTLKRFDVFYDTGRLRYLEPVFLSLSHVCALMSRNLFEKFMLLSAAECFK
ncbi:hypothetical protein HPB50_011950 [Hyalomma asiaticum]|uniref:Uncharacterized protein n=1 Tax=Hyalomma asiaticum TaxID=266040 RepID=A0ACB7RIU3_HYAAI|nr:hypothetical protein HPB50_011950 [Hyalomma asiaticum]